MYFICELTFIGMEPTGAEPSTNLKAESRRKHNTAVEFPSIIVIINICFRIFQKTSVRFVQVCLSLCSASYPQMSVISPQNYLFNFNVKETAEKKFLK